MDPPNEMTLEEAKALSAKYEIGDIVNIPVDNVEFGRIAAGNGKQVIIQGLREAERGMVYDEFNSKQHEILTGAVTRIDPRTGERIPADRQRHGRPPRPCSPLGEQVRGEELVEGMRHEGLCGGGPPQYPGSPDPHLPDPSGPCQAAVRAGGAGDLRRHRGDQAPSPGRPAAAPRWPCGPTSPNVDPIGACVGPKGQRVADHRRGAAGARRSTSSSTARTPPSSSPPPWLPPTWWMSWMAGARARPAACVVPDDQLSLAIGKEGQNARLAARLTGYKIDIKPESYRTRRGARKPLRRAANLERIMTGRRSAMPESEEDPPAAVRRLPGDEG